MVFPQHANDTDAEAAYQNVQEIVDAGYYPVYWNTTSSVLRILTSSGWDTYSPGGGGGTSVLADGSVAMTADLDLDSNKITNLANGTAAGDAVNKSQLDLVQNGIKFKAAVTVATTADLSATYNATTGGSQNNGQLTGVATDIDGYTLQVGDRVLVKDQSNADENGIYEVTAIPSTVTLERSDDFDVDAEVDQSAVTYVLNGDVYGNSTFVLLTADPITVGGASGSDLNWTIFGGAPGDTGFIDLADTVVACKDATNQAWVDSGIRGGDTIHTTVAVRETMPLQKAQNVTGTVTLDLEDGNTHRVIVNPSSPATITIGQPSNITSISEMQSITLYIKNIASTPGNLTLAWHSWWKFPDGAPTGIDTQNDTLIIDGQILGLHTGVTNVFNSKQVTI